MRGAVSLVRVAGYFAQAGVDLWDQLYVTGAVRADQSSTFPKADRTNWYPKASVAWNVVGTGSRGESVDQAGLSCGYELTPSSFTLPL